MASKKKVGRKKKSGGLSASEFIRRQPVTLKAAEVVAAGGKAGIKFTPGLVYIVRGRLTAKGTTGGAVRGRRAGSKSRKALAADSSRDAQFRRLVVELGVAQANVLVGEIERGMQALIRGR